MDTRNNLGILQNTPENKAYQMASRYRMIIRRLPNVTYFCQSVTLPGISIGEVSQATLFNPIKHTTGPMVQDNLIINFVIDEDFKTWRELRTWMLNCMNYKDFAEYTIPSEHLSDEVTVFLTNNNHIPTFKYTFEGAFPVGLGGLVLSSAEPDSQHIIGSASFTYTSFRIEQINAS